MHPGGASSHKYSIGNLVPQPKSGAGGGFRTPFLLGVAHMLRKSMGFDRGKCFPRVPFSLEPLEQVLITATHFMDTHILMNSETYACLKNENINKGNY